MLLMAAKDDSRNLLNKYVKEHVWHFEQPDGWGQSKPDAVGSESLTASGYGGADDGICGTQGLLWGSTESGCPNTTLVWPSYSCTSLWSYITAGSGKVNLTLGQSASWKASYTYLLLNFGSLASSISCGYSYNIWHNFCVVSNYSAAHVLDIWLYMDANLIWSSTSVDMSATPRGTGIVLGGMNTAEDELAILSSSTAFTSTTAQALATALFRTKSWIVLT